jgi:hypothetical protein
VWPYRDFAVGVAVKSEMAYFMGDDDSFIRRSLMFCDIYKPCGTIKRAKYAWTEVEIAYL